MENFLATESLHDQILEYTGKDISIGAGSGLSIDDPLRLLAPENFGYTETDIISLYLRDYASIDWNVVNQEIEVVGYKIIDWN